MNRLKAHVRGGRLILDEPTNLPEGAVVELVAADTWDGLDENDRVRLHNALAAADEDVRDGRLVSAEEILAKLR